MFAKNCELRANSSELRTVKFIFAKIIIFPEDNKKIQKIHSMKGKISLSNSEIKSALETCGGNISAAAAYLSCPRTVIYRRMKKHPELQQARDEAEEIKLDYYEAALDKAALINGDVSAIKYVLSTRGKKRGYSEKQEVRPAETGINITLEKVDYTRQDRRDD